MDSAGNGFEEFVRDRSPALLRRAYLLCAGDGAAAEDLLQDVLARMYVRWRSVRSDPEPYARASLANAAANRWRHRARRVRESPMPVDLSGQVEGPENGTAERDAAVRALSVLAPRTRAVLVLRFFEDLTEEQTAAVLGCRVGTVKSLAHRGLLRLRAVLADQEHSTTVGGSQ